jgi:gluconate kinase
MQLIVVTGVPGAGKSTVAQLLAQELGLPLISLDRLKEAVYDAVAPVRVSAYGYRLAAEAAMASLLADVERGAVVDVWLDPTRHDRDRLVAALPAKAEAREVWCDVDPEVAVQRYRARHRHAMHRREDEEVFVQIRRTAAMLRERGPQSAGLGSVFRFETSAPAPRPAVLRACLEWMRVGEPAETGGPGQPSEAGADAGPRASSDSADSEATALSAEPSAPPSS